MQFVTGVQRAGQLCSKAKIGSYQPQPGGLQRGGQTCLLFNHLSPDKHLLPDRCLKQAEYTFERGLGHLLVRASPSIASECQFQFQCRLHENADDGYAMLPSNG